MEKFTLKPAAGYLANEAVLDDIAAGVHDAGNPYFDYLFGDAAETRAILRKWIRRPTSEVYAGHAQLLFDGATLVGGFIAMTGAECKARRLADAAALLALSKSPSRAGLLSRLAATKGLFASLKNGDWYVSKLWVGSSFRGRGHASVLAKAAFFPAVAPPGRSLADVSADNTPALRTYARQGIESVEQHASPSGHRYVVVCAGAT